jgi:asparagine synthase (glutamine-hydrolysing)
MPPPAPPRSTRRGGPRSTGRRRRRPGAARPEPFRGTGEEAVERLDALLRDAVAGRMIADVPLGAFLSGGIDSSTVVALMQAQSARPVRTFSIGFHHKNNEAQFAGAVARHLGTDHTALYVDGKDTLAVVDRMPEVYDEPFADSSQIPTWIISHLARRHVTVALSGDGGDELFYGYRRYFRGRKIWSSLSLVPIALRRAAARAVRLAAPGEPREGKLHALAADLEAASPDAMFRNRVSFWKNPAELVLGGSEPVTLSDEVTGCIDPVEPDRRMMLLDLLTFLADDILVKVDRASMAVSLEVRAPILDHRVIELAFALPMTMKFRDGKGKWVLRQVLARYVPPQLTERPKVGFGSPIADWLRGALRDWAEELLTEERLRREGYFHPATVRAMWSENLAGRRKWHNHLWPVLMFQAWLERNVRC